MPKKVVDNCLRQYFGYPERGDVTYPFEVMKHDKTIHVSHHAVSIGTNKFKDCDAVVYLWDNHLPASVSVQRYHILSDDPITDESLEDANKSRLLGNYERIRDAQYLDNIMQHIGRGNVRNISDDQQVGTMTAYVLSRGQDMFTRLATQYRGCQVKVLNYPEHEILVAPTRMGQILDYLLKYGNGKIARVRLLLLLWSFLLNSINAKHFKNLGSDFWFGFVGKGMFEFSKSILNKLQIV